MMKLVKRTFDTVLGLCLEGVQVAEDGHAEAVRLFVERCEREGA